MLQCLSSSDQETDSPTLEIDVSCLLSQEEINNWSCQKRRRKVLKKLAKKGQRTWGLFRPLPYCVQKELFPPMDSDSCLLFSAESCDSVHVCVSDKNPNE